MCASNHFSTTVIVQGNSHTAPAAVPSAVSGVAIVIQLPKEVPITFSYGPVSMIVMGQSFEAGRPTFADFSAVAKMEHFPMCNLDAVSGFNHVRNNI